MQTSIADIFEAIDAELAADQDLAVPDAAAALVQAAKVLRRLCREGYEQALRAEHATAVSAVVTTSSNVAKLWPREAGRLASLVGIVGDSVGRLRDELTQSDRWAIAIRLAPVVRECCAAIEASGPYGHVGELKSFDRALSSLRRVAAANPPEPERCVGLIRPIPGMGSPAVLGPAEGVFESVAELVDHLKRPGRERLSLREMLAACRVAQQMAETAEDVVSDLVAAGAADAWESAGRQLAKFRDVIRPATFGGLTPIAKSALDSVEAVRGMDQADLTPIDVELLRKSVAMLPVIGAVLDQELVRLRRTLIVPVGPAPIREARVAEWLQKKPFIPDRDDLVDAHKALQAARRSAQAEAGRQAAAVLGASTGRGLAPTL